MAYKETGEKGGVFSSFGIIQTIDVEEDRVVVLLTMKISEYDFNQLDEIELAYAITVHKSQGSEFPVVIMPISWGPPMLLTHNLLYTAVTRAKSLVVLVGMERYWQIWLKNDYINKDILD